jgi:hypothetical protein
VQPKDLFTVFFPELAIEVLTGGSRFRSYEALVIDEAQDLLLPQYLDVMDLLLRGGLDEGVWRAFYDPNQNLFEAIHPESLRRLRRGAAVYRLTVNCRNTAPIGTATAVLSGVPLVEHLRIDGPEVRHFWVHDIEAQRHQIAKVVRELLKEGVVVDQLVILSPVSIERSCLAHGLPGGPSVRELSTTGDCGDGVPFSTIHAFKGLEADIVILVDLGRLDLPASKSAVYVGTSRARALLVLVMPESLRAQYAECAKRFGERISAGAPGPAMH